MKILLVLSVILNLILLLAASILYFKNYKMRYIFGDYKQVELWHTLAYTDDLTGTYNRTAFNKYIHEIGMTKKSKKLGIILFDVDNFKDINDTHGHLERDAVLKLVSQVLREVYEYPKYNIYRIGGDEFAVIGKDVTEEEIIQQLIYFRNKLLSEREIYVSVGYSEIKGDFDTAFKHADEMLYADKASRKIPFERSVH